MTNEEFGSIVNSTLEECKNTLTVKAVEYQRNNNPFHNFDKGVKITNKSREDVIWGFALKHFISIQDIKDDLKNGIIPSEELLDEKYGDLINYLLFEKASILEIVRIYDRQRVRESANESFKRG